MIGAKIESILGILGDTVYARDDQQRLYATGLAAIPAPELDDDMQADPVKWTVRKKLTHALLRPGELKRLKRRKQSKIRMTGFRNRFIGAFDAPALVVLLPESSH